MTKPEKQILVCGSFRASGESQGGCEKKGAIGLVPYIQEELADRGMDGVSVAMTSCLNMCDRGPVMAIFPDNIWYGGVDSEDVVDQILDALEGGRTVEELLLT
ncbi:(2Fe-2S) ferredoxin domain-containing protein [Sediminispirochaeta smaragdinae]|uniref:Ferredoxin, 2Fe-2S n=1 Tax=Sediminispirochaeta smaragdinae (strain DSM 11293 / JCM 15392 / SEBR 4228) TaxID=573413 RepID=E1R3Y1_SEDSS|nr:(2Fe-2S) ferredoxin domain-containing protein [Sediminispirochaeta smaragdinae]ADK82102.1 ferredoxin, 2Fe-2S [Sediminispirochaeta smaragdinae DSM 11293]